VFDASAGLSADCVPPSFAAATFSAERLGNVTAATPAATGAAVPSSFAAGACGAAASAAGAIAAATALAATCWMTTGAGQAATVASFVSVASAVLESEGLSWVVLSVSVAPASVGAFVMALFAAVMTAWQACALSTDSAVALLAGLAALSLLLAFLPAFWPALVFASALGCVPDALDAFLAGAALGAG